MISPTLWQEDTHKYETYFCKLLTKIVFLRVWNNGKDIYGTPSVK